VFEPESARELLFLLPTYGHFDVACKCLQSFVEHTPTGIYYVIVLDDASPDWPELDMSRWPACPSRFVRFGQNGGLTRSWNAGLSLANAFGFEYVLCGNSDLLFSEGWYPPLKKAIDDGFDLVGPVTNAPGHSALQDVRRYVEWIPDDDHQYLTSVATLLSGREHAGIVKTRFINGFCMFARTAAWWAGRFDSLHVFDPSRKMVGNEDELQNRWRRLGRRIGVVTRSFVFHYRSVSRAEALAQPASRGAFRRSK
jgi:GT2 family glycosyltransferase